MNIFPTNNFLPCGFINMITKWKLCTVCHNWKAWLCLQYTDRMHRYTLWRGHSIISRGYIWGLAIGIQVRCSSGTVSWAMGIGRSSDGGCLFLLAWGPLAIEFDVVLARFDFGCQNIQNIFPNVFPYIKSFLFARMDGHWVVVRCAATPSRKLVFPVYL